MQKSLFTVFFSLIHCSLLQFFLLEPKKLFTASILPFGNKTTVHCLIILRRICSAIRVSSIGFFLLPARPRPCPLADVTPFPLFYSQRSQATVAGPWRVFPEDRAPLPSALLTRLSVALATSFWCRGALLVYPSLLAFHAD